MNKAPYSAGFKPTTAHLAAEALAPSERVHLVDVERRTSDKDVVVVAAEVRGGRFEIRRQILEVKILGEKLEIARVETLKMS